MVSQFVPATIVWTLHVETKSNVPALRNAQDFPVIGWAHTVDDDGVMSLEAIISYKGEPKGQIDVLEDLRADVLDQCKRLGVSTRGNLAYTLVPA